MAHSWGGIDEGENPIQTLIREIEEEVGLHVSPDQIQLIDNEGSGEAVKTIRTGETVQVEMTFWVYQVKLDQAAKDVIVSLDDDLVESTWVTQDELTSLKHTPPSIALFTRLGWI